MYCSSIYTEVMEYAVALFTLEVMEYTVALFTLR